MKNTIPLLRLRRNECDVQALIRREGQRNGMPLACHVSNFADARFNEQRKGAACSQAAGIPGECLRRT